MEGGAYGGSVVTLMEDVVDELATMVALPLTVPLAPFVAFSVKDVALTDGVKPSEEVVPFTVTSISLAESDVTLNHG